MKKKRINIPGGVPEGYERLRLGVPIESGDLMYWADGWRGVKEDIGFNVRMGMLVVRREKNNGGNQ